MILLSLFWGLFIVQHSLTIIKKLSFFPINIPQLINIFDYINKLPIHYLAVKINYILLVYYL